MIQASGLTLLSNAAADGMTRDGSGMQPPSENVSPAEPLADQEKKEKESFLMFTRVLMKYLKLRDIIMHTKARATIKECYEKNKTGDPNFRSLTNSMKERLRRTVGEVYWKKADDCLNHFLKQKMMTEKSNAANRKRRAEQKKRKEEEKTNQLIASKDKEITEKDKEIAILKESLEISKQIGAVELSDEEIAILQDAVETVDMTNDELEPASKRPRTEDTPMKSLAGILLEETGKKVVKVKQEQMETRADLEDVRDDLDIANETVTQQAVFTDAWQSKFDELAAIAQAAGVDGKIISEIRNRSITNGSS